MTEVADLTLKLMKTTNVDGKWSTISMTTWTINVEHSDDAENLSNGRIYPFVCNPNGQAFSVDKDKTSSQENSSVHLCCGALCFLPIVWFGQLERTL